MSYAPSTNTFASAAIGVPLATIAAWVVNLCCQVAVPGEVQAALGALITVLIGYVAEVVQSKRAAAAAGPP